MQGLFLEGPVRSESILPPKHLRRQAPTEPEASEGSRSLTRKLTRKGLRLSGYSLEV